jgi:hypothetical protein
LPIILDEIGQTYESVSFEKEAEFESIVVELSDQIFGPNTIYLDIKKRLKGKEIISIPDAYLIDLTTPHTPKLYVIENEIVSHDPFKHIGIQMIKKLQLHLRTQK